MITDDDLILYHYRELDADERARIAAALGAQPELAHRLHALVARLDAAAAIPEVPVPAQTQQRWQDALARAASAPRQAGARRASAPRPVYLQPRWQFAAAAALAVVAILAVLQFQSPSTPAPGTRVATTIEPPKDASAYENGLKFHLASTERRLASLGAATPEDRARMIEAIIGQNRIYALAAERAGEPQLARVLRAFTPILQSLANDDGDAAASAVSQLSFELRVMQSRLAAEASPPTI